MAIYNGKHCVFESVRLDSTAVIWNSASNVDSDNAYNDWNISDMRNTRLPAKLSALSSDLQSVITNTTIQTATNGINGTLVSTSDKLFLAAEKEMTASPTKARTEESNALITWSYWTTHTQNSDRIKRDGFNTGREYWLRSPYSGNTTNVLNVYSNGSFDYNMAGNTFRFSPCFAF